MSDAYVYVAEAWKDGECVEQLVHTNIVDARDDIESSKYREDADETTINKRKLYLGTDDEFHAER